MSRQNQQETYTLTDVSFMHLVKAIKRNGSNLTPNNLIASLDPSKIIELLNNPYNGCSTVLRSCIESEREDKLELFKKAIEAGAILKPDELLGIFISEGLSDELRPAFFEVTMKQIYKRIDKITSIDDEVFAHIHAIESFLSIHKNIPLRNDLIKDRFPQEFRTYLAPILSGAGINHAEFTAKLYSFYPDRNAISSLSRVGNAEWLTLLTPPTKDVVVEVDDVTVVSDESSRRSSDGSNSSAEIDPNSLYQEGVRKRNVASPLEAESKTGDDVSADTDPLLNKDKNSNYHQEKAAESKGVLDSLKGFLGL